MKYLKQFLEKEFTDPPAFLKLQVHHFPHLSITKYTSTDNSIFNLRIAHPKTRDSLMKFALFRVTETGGFQHWEPKEFYDESISKHLKKPMSLSILRADNWENQKLIKALVTIWDCQLKNSEFLDSKNILDIQGIKPKQHTRDVTLGNPRVKI